MKLNEEIYLIARSERLKSLISFMGVKRSDLAKILGYSVATISYWENSKFGGLQKKGAREIADFAKSKDIICNADWLMEGAGDAPKRVQKGKVVDNLPESQIQEEEIALFLSGNPYSVAVTIDDDGMLPYFKPLDIVGCVIVPLDHFEIGKTGETVLVETEKDPHLRLIKPGERLGTFDLSYIHYGDDTKRSFQINCVKLDKIGVIKRLWRDR